MNDYPLPKETIHDLGKILVHLGRRLLNVAKAIIKRLAPFLRPPDDMHIRTGDGGKYSGVLIIEENDITTGAVARVSQDPPRYDQPRYQERYESRSAYEPSSRPWSSSEQETRRSSALTHWAHDPREDEEAPWLR